MRRLLLCCMAVLTTFVLLGCSSKSNNNVEEQTSFSPERIEKKFASGVVLIRNVHYFVMTFGGGLSFYFTGLDEDGDPTGISVDEDDVEPKAIYGTGFFVNKEGVIATNSHVASPKVDEESVRSSLMSMLSYISSEFQKDVNNLNVIMAALVTEIVNAETTSEERQYKRKLEEAKEERDKKQKFISSVSSLSNESFKITTKMKIGIAYHNTYATSQNDFVDCVLKTDDEEHDLALIQLKSKETPEKCHVFRLPKTSEKKKSEVGTELFMLGYNLGPALAITEDGIMAQVTSGKITQDRGETEIMYDISTLNGSSGSPVINKRGQLVAINHAGLNATQGFNVGIKVAWLRKLMED